MDRSADEIDFNTDSPRSLLYWSTGHVVLFAPGN